MRKPEHSESVFFPWLMSLQHFSNFFFVIPKKNNQNFVLQKLKLNCSDILSLC